MNQDHETDSIPLAEAQGEVAGLSYRVSGAGPPLILLPMDYAPSQWEPLLPTLAQHYSTIALGGAWLGVVALLESRAKGGYLDVVQKVVDETRIQLAERIAVLVAVL